MEIDKGSKPGGQSAARGSPIAFRLDSASGVPTYLQLVHQVEQALRLGYLQQRDRLPTIKDVVEWLAINPNTVLKAYRELEHRGLAVGRPGQGTFIDGTLRRVGLAQQAELRKGLMTWLRSAEVAGLDEAGIVALFGSSLRDFLEHRGARGDAPGRRRSAARENQSGAVA